MLLALLLLAIFIDRRNRADFLGRGLVLGLSVSRHRSLARHGQAGSDLDRATEIEAFHSSLFRFLLALLVRICEVTPVYTSLISRGLGADRL